MTEQPLKPTLESKLFPLERVLTISADTYDSVGRLSKNYDYVGIHAIVLRTQQYVNRDNTVPFGPFLRMVPQSAEVVVDYKVVPIGDSGDLYVFGTALVPNCSDDDIG